MGNVDTDPWEDMWPDPHGGFPWYMDEDSVDEQAARLIDPLDRALDTESFTKDMPDLSLWEDHYLFVYGTLKRNKSNHRVLDNKNCRYLADCYTADPHFVLKETRGGIPVALGLWGTNDKSAKRIKGELYLVKTSEIRKLDVFEQNGVIYKRLKMRLAIPRPKGTDELATGWMYLGLKHAWADSNESLVTCPSYDRKRKDKVEAFYTYTGKDK